MLAVIRNYSGAGVSELFNRIDNHSDEIRNLLNAVDGFVSYTIARTEEGGFSVTVCKDQDGIDASVGVAKNWVAENAADLGVAAPDITVGTVFIQENA